MKLQSDYTKKWLEVGNAAANASERMRKLGMEKESKRLQNTATYCFMRYEQTTTGILENNNDLIASYIGVTFATIGIIGFLYLLIFKL